MRILDDRQVKFCTIRAKHSPSGRAGLLYRDRLYTQGPSFGPAQREEALRQCTEEEMIGGQLCILLEEKDGGGYTLYIQESPCGDQCHAKSSRDRRVIEMSGISYRCFASYSEEMQERASEHYQISLDSGQHVLLLVGNDGSRTIWRGEFSTSSVTPVPSAETAAPADAGPTQVGSARRNELLAGVITPVLAVS